MKKTVLVVTRSDDASAGPVLEALAERGARAFRFDTDRFPTEVRYLGHLGSPRRCLLADGDDELDLSEVSSVWYRRLHPGGLLPNDMDAQLRRASILETRATILGMIASLGGFHMDPVERVHHACNKQLQLELAKRLGLAIPPTLISNDPASVRAFARQCGGRVVAKMLSSFAIYEDGREQVVFTTEVAPADLADLERLRLCPMTFQAQIPKQLELRATAVGDRLFTAAVDSQRSDDTRVDWRRDGLGLVGSWTHYALPKVIERRLLKMLAHFGLHYGAFDLILTPDGRYVFLELNPSGEFLWLDAYSKLPIASAIAEVLLGRHRRKRAQRQGPMLR
jgi:glutathione synthase/RimK-type ligase-like ATP-grasp enzyme